MSALGLPGWLVGVTCLALAAFALVRLIVVAPADRDIEATKILMAASMGAMVLPTTSPWWLWPAILSTSALLAGYRLRRAPARDPHRGHRAHHLAASIAMAYLLLAAHLTMASGMPMPAGSPMAGAVAAPATTMPTPLGMLMLAGDLAVLGFLAGSAVIAALGLTRLQPAPLPPVGPAPRTTAAGQLLMSLLMLDMAPSML